MELYSIQRAFLLAILLAVAGCDGCRQPVDPPAPTPPQEFQPTAEAIDLHNRAVALMGHFDYDGAYQVLEQLVNENPTWFDAKVDWAISTLNRRQTGDDKRATELLQTVIDANPADLRAKYCLGILRLDGGDPAGALEVFSAVAEGDPTDAYAAYYAGQCEFQLNNVEPALTRYQQALKRDPYLRSCYYGAFQATRRLGDLETAKQHLADFEKLDGNPQARLAEIKYTRMGPKAELKAVEMNDSAPPIPPEGPLFATPSPLVDADGRDVPWRVADGDAPPVNVTTAFLSDDVKLVVLANGSADESRPNLVFQATKDRLTWLPDHPLASIINANAFVWGDYDNDGWVDVYVCCDGPNQLWRQVELNDWRNVTESTKTSGTAINSLDGQFVDADHDGDLDLLIMNDGDNELFNNNLDGTFRPLAAEQGLTGDGARAVSSVVLDIDHDRDLDFIEINAEPPHAVYLNDRLWAYRRWTGGTDAPADATADGGAADNEAVGADGELTDQYDAIINAPLRAVVAIDRATDGQSELLGLQGGQLVVLEPDASGRWSIQPLAKQEVSDWRGPFSVADIDGDAVLDLVGQTSTGWAVVSAQDGAVKHREATALFGWCLLNFSADQGPTLLGVTATTGQTWGAGAGRFPFLRVGFTGKEESADQMRSNRSGIGVDAAARLGTVWTKLRTLRGSSGPGQSYQPLAVGLRGRDRLDFVRVVWPDGIFQTEFDLDAGKLHDVSETQRQVASCPVVFAWNGQEYGFITDVLGVGGLGFNVGYGEYGEPRPWENLLLPEACLQPRKGRFEIKIGEPMEEACYLDAVKLVAYDVPQTHRMTIDERFAIMAPQPTGLPLFYRELKLPVRAKNDRGDDVLAQIAEVDFTAAEPGARDSRFIGRTAPHSIELVFADNIDGPATYLLFDGWIEYPYSQTMFAAWQANATFDAPNIEAQGEDGEWVLVQEQFGYMAGMPRQAVVPLADLPKGTKRLRLTSSVEVYWDRLGVIHATDCPDVKRTELPLKAAALAEVGFAERTNLPQRRPHYDYSKRSPLWDTRHMKGYYTDFGDVQEIVKETDDAVAIMGPGEEVHLEFEASLQSVPQGYDRWFVLELNGWCKDMDLYTRDGETLEPLPVRGVDDPAARSRREQLHERSLRRFRVGQ